jgi:hypothetical protein
LKLETKLGENKKKQHHHLLNKLTIIILFKFNDYKVMMNDFMIEMHSNLEKIQTIEGQANKNLTLSLGILNLIEDKMFYDFVDKTFIIKIFSFYN